MKKIIVLLVLCACCGGALCAQGVGLGYNMFWSHTHYSTNNVFTGETPMNDSSWNGQAVFLYVDGLFVEANVGVTINATYREHYNRAKHNTLFHDLDTTDLKLALFVKGPWIVYPLVGVEWFIPLRATYWEENQPHSAKGQMWEDIQKQFNNLWLKAGVGLDIPLGKISLRPQFLAGYRLNTAKELEMINNKKYGEPSYKRIFGYSFEGRLALGFRF